jgi:hypothetical protein
MRIKFVVATKTFGRYGALSLLLVALLLAPISASSQSASSQDESGAGPQRAAFSGDGYADLAVGVPWESIGSVPYAGGVNVLYGSAARLSADGDQLWHQDKPGIEGTAEVGDYFGLSLAAGDFDGDGYADLAVGVPFEPIGSVDNAGCVNVLYGSDAGLSADGNQFWDQDQPGIEDTAQAGDLFGYALAAGDFDGDGYADLAVGVPDEAIGSVTSAGGVNVLYGSSAGLSADGNQFWDQDQPGIEGAPEAGDHFGETLAAGDFDGDGYADLAVGVPYESIGSVASAGAVNLLYGSAAGLTADGNQFWNQYRPGIEDTVEVDDFFGTALAAGDLNGDGYADLAVGVPGESIGSVASAGGVNVLYGSDAGLTADGNQFWDQDQPDIEGAPEAGDRFGETLAAGDFDGDGSADLAVGVPHESIGSVESAGAVNLLYGSATGLSADGNQFWDQDQPDVEGTAEAGDDFGLALAAGDLNGDGYADLAVGVPGEPIGSLDEAGGVNLLYGSDVGLSADGNQLWDQDQPDIEGTAEAYDSFGFALVTMPAVEAEHGIYVPLVVRE